MDQSSNLRIVVHIADLGPAQACIHALLLKGNVGRNSKMHRKRCAHMGPYSRLDLGSYQAKRGYNRVANPSDDISHQ